MIFLLQTPISSAAVFLYPSCLPSCKLMSSKVNVPHAHAPSNKFECIELSSQRSNMHGVSVQYCSAPARGMATEKQIMMRINATKNISKITQSMKMVSAAKLRGDEARLRAAQPFNVSTKRRDKILAPPSSPPPLPISSVRDTYVSKCTHYVARLLVIIQLWFIYIVRQCCACHIRSKGRTAHVFLTWSMKMNNAGLGA